MNIHEVRECLSIIKKEAHDCEGAHSREDSLHQNVLREIRDHSTDQLASAIAREALLTLDIEFERWCA